MKSRTVASILLCVTAVLDSPRLRVDHERMAVGRGAGHRLGDEGVIEELDGQNADRAMLSRKPPAPPAQALRTSFSTDRGSKYPVRAIAAGERRSCT